MAQRVLAVLGAVGIVLAAVAVRSVIDDGGDSSAHTGGTRDGSVVVVCATELAEACSHLNGVTIVSEQAADTADRIISGDAAAAGVDGWVTTSAWTEVLESRAPRHIAESVPLAESRVVVAIDPARTQAVRAACSTGSLWRCLGDNSGAEWETLHGDARWGALKTGLPSAESAVGLAVLASVTSGFFGGAGFATNDFDPSGFASWLGRLAAPSGTGETDPVGTLVTARGKYTGVGDLRSAAVGRPVDVLEPAPALRATVMLVQLPGGDTLPSPTKLRDALTAGGWDPVDPTASVPNTFKPGVMSALQSLWMEVTR